MTRLPAAALLLVAASASAAPLELLPAADYAKKVLAPRHGRPLAVSFWATWCDPCREELPALLRAAASEKMELVLVSLDSGKSGDAARAFLASVKSGVPAFIAAPGDPEVFIDAIDKTWDGTLPYTLVYGGDGKIRERLRGAHEEPDFRRAFSPTRTRTR